MSSPEVSVVMSVYNDAEYLVETIESILVQAVDLEFIIVNDGSTDGSQSILQQYALSDSRIRLIEQQNSGLTQALHSACKLAQAPFIARQDAGDISLPDRLISQLNLIKQDTRIAMVVGGTEHIAPEGELFNALVPEPYAASEALRSDALSTLESPGHHGCMMFSRKVYEQVGGYRPCFVVAQDLDLWTRMIDVGLLAVVPKMIYRARAIPNSISATQRHRQQAAKTLIHKASLARRAGLSEQSFLDQANAELDRLSRIEFTPDRRSTLSSFYYFIGACMAASQPAAARKYFYLAWKHKPLNLKAILRYITTR